MTDVAIVAAVAIVVLAAVLLVVRRGDEQVLRSRMRAEVIVTAVDVNGLELAFSGVLTEYDRRVLVLKHARQLDGTNEVAVDGEVILTWDRISFVQRP